jgi:hypothetical protein
MDIVDQMEAWRKNARFISEQDFFSRMMFEIRTNRNEIERLREALQSIKKVPNSEAAYGIIQTFVDEALKEKE